MAPIAMESIASDVQQPTVTTSPATRKRTSTSTASDASVPVEPQTSGSSNMQRRAQKRIKTPAVVRMKQTKASVADAERQPAKPTVSDGKLYTIERVVKEGLRRIDGKLQKAVSVKWMGYPASQNSWIPRRSVVSVRNDGPSAHDDGDANSESGDRDSSEHDDSENNSSDETDTMTETEEESGPGGDDDDDDNGDDTNDKDHAGHREGITLNGTSLPLPYRWVAYE